MMLAGVRKRLEMKGRRQAQVGPALGVAATCALCGGVYRAPAEGARLCPACEAEATRLAAVGDPRVTA